VDTSEASASWQWILIASLLGAAVLALIIVGIYFGAKKCREDNIANTNASTDTSSVPESVPLENSTLVPATTETSSLPALTPVLPPAGFRAPRRKRRTAEHINDPDEEQQLLDSVRNSVF
jgi:hypothetical protein